LLQNSLTSFIKNIGIYISNGDFMTSIQDLPKMFEHVNSYINVIFQFQLFIDWQTLFNALILHVVYPERTDNSQ
jgi:hypothetical protein